jgi:predicted MFS family arabinose efflux permease
MRVRTYPTPARALSGNSSPYQSVLFSMLRHGAIACCILTILETRTPYSGLPDMTDTAEMTQPTAEKERVSPWLVLLLTFACGLMAGNIYYAQPLVGLIAASLGVAKGAAGLIVTMTQIGTGVGMLFIVPLGDLIESRRLALTLLCIAALGLLGAALSQHAALFLVAACLIGLGSVAIHVLVPYAAHLAPERIRGRVVGNVTSGVLLGIMLARPASSFVTQLSSSWHTIFFLSAALMAALMVLLAVALPPREPLSKLRYVELLASMRHLVATQPVVRRRSFYTGCLGAAFSLFWTTTPLLLAGPAFSLSQGGIALFALVGVSGAIAATVSGSLADRGWTRPATCVAILAVIAALLLSRAAAPGAPLSLTLLVVAGIVLDFGVSSNISLGQRAIFALGAQFRSRVNGIYMTTFFAGSALGSALGGWSYAQGGWSLTSLVGLAFALAALIYFVADREHFVKRESPAS